MAERLVITGASGFIGRHAVAHVSATGETHILLRRPSSIGAIDAATRNRCGIHHVDLLDPAGVARCFRDLRPTHLLHLAWHADANRWTSAANVEWAAATLMMLRQFAEHGGRRLVVGGSCAEYDWTAAQFKEDETPLQPRTMYGMAKAATHQLIAAAAGEYGLSVGWGHVFFCYGPGEPTGRLVSDVITGVLEGRRVACTAGTQIRDYMHTGDVGRALALLVRSEFHGSMNIASGTGVAVRDLAQRAADLAGRGDLLDFGARPTSPTEPARIVGDTTRLTDILRFEPEFTIDRGLAQTVDWFREHSIRPHA